MESIQPSSGEPLQPFIPDGQPALLLVVGLTTDYCISTTVRMAGNLGFDTYVVNDATATFPKKGFDGKSYSAEDIHQTALASLNEEFATVLNTEDIIKTFI
ncbi:isochorismatase family protein [Prolixibacter sp. SD074]|jgi:nicotinamidase-related amidase|uniref:isochorismatase family protein n=1 Tax=Prolixibacter sp. SD074 TaxID=2652391 RepID=UPI00127A64CC|nr:isochorismatase family protein [Prolixibacter sp. SD074]GET29003.1 hypothetical protein SD074_12050 [Prolixibacter sp. SD074]